MPSIAFPFMSPGGYELAGKLETPEGDVRAWAVFAHCFTCGKDSLAASRLARALAAAGIGTLRFDFAGLGGSGGEFASGFGDDTRDLVAAGRAMAASGRTPSLMVGHSLGGAAVLAAAHDMPDIQAIATIGAPFDVAHVLHQFDPSALEQIRSEGAAEVRLADRPFRVSRRFIDELGGHDLGRQIGALHRPLLVMHAPRDATVGIENASRIFVSAKHPKSFVSLEDADHLLTRPADARYVANLIAAWAEPHLAAPPQPARPAEGPVSAEETGAGRYQVRVRAGPGDFVADEPQSVGGLGSGPTPYQLVAAGLAACTTMTLRLYAERKGLVLGPIRTTVGHRKLDDGGDVFERHVHLEGEIDAAQRQRLLEIADRCPVDRTLSRASTVTAVVDDRAPAANEPTSQHLTEMEAAAR